MEKEKAFGFVVISQMWRVGMEDNDVYVNIYIYISCQMKMNDQVSHMNIFRFYQMQQLIEIETAYIMISVKKFILWNVVFLMLLNDERICK